MVCSMACFRDVMNGSTVVRAIASYMGSCVVGMQDGVPTSRKYTITRSKHGAIITFIQTKQ